MYVWLIRNIYIYINNIYIYIYICRIILICNVESGLILTWFCNTTTQNKTNMEDTKLILKKHMLSCCLHVFPCDFWEFWLIISRGKVNIAMMAESVHLWSHTKASNELRWEKCKSTTDIELSHEKTLTTFHYTVCLIGILIMVHYNAYITGEYNALYTPTNHGFFIAHNCMRQLTHLNHLETS